MKNIVFVLMFLVLVMGVGAQEFLYDRESINAELTISSGIEIVPDRASYELDYVRANLIYFPQNNFQQRISSVVAEPAGDIQDEGVLYEWNNPVEKELDYSLSAIVDVSDNVLEVKGKVKFPIEVPKELEEYTEPSNFINSDDPDIIKTASEIISGEDDLFVVLFKLASWTEQNIEYNLSTLTVDASQSASWVLQNRIGVCDELTSLFISMARAVGIPARFVSGIAYTTAEYFDKNWLPHGWAEVWVPGHGWVPFDPTYGEYGYVDVSHIKLQDSLGPGEAASKYEWRGEVDLDLKEIEFRVDIKRVGAKSSPDVTLDVNVLRDNVGFGSANLITVEVRNRRDYYVARTFFLSSPPEVDVGREKQAVILRPGETKTLYWVVNVDENLLSNFIYTMPVLVYNEKNVSVRTSFKVEEDSVVLGLEQVQSLIINGEEEKELTKEVDLECSLDKNLTVVGEDMLLSCSLKNKGNVILRNHEICIDGECEFFDLNINEEKSFEGVIPTEEVGKFEAVGQISGDLVRESYFVEYTVLDEPQIIIGEVGHPEVVGFKEVFDVSFLLSRESFARPKNVDIVVKVGRDKNAFEIEEFIDDKQFNIEFIGKQLRADENKIEVSVQWEDDFGKIYSESRSVVVRLEGLTFWQGVQSFFLNLY